ncbi:DUF4252 domain-containing protein [Candidatus Kaistella beijingensis]|uniref:DUF4252 domain-containing protein n=1 Tax=Candidatus Kaistella beijingensis TaxID=2820270 RepID=UPI001CC5FB46|nr:DUF4252 domain-containing protein [Candidatus Kaistella beijingensis]UBB89440.1 DUF4252 domain-containing protein [Candidatus Kaistella beijingensis]
MKKITIFSLFAVLIFSLQSCIVSKHPNMGFFDNPYYDYKDAKFVSINVPMFLAKPIVKKALREDGESEELINLIKKVADVKVMVVSNGNEEMIGDFAKYLTKNNFEEWMTIKKENEIIKFQAKQNGEEIRNLLITVASGKDLVYVDVKGKFTADNISKIINYSEKNDLKKIVSK